MGNPSAMLREKWANGSEVVFLPPKGRRFNKQASPKPLTKLSSTHLLSLSCPMMSYYPAIAMTSGGTILLPQGCSVGICSVSRVYA